MWRLTVIVLAGVSWLAAEEPLTNQGLVQLAEAGYSEEFLLDLIKSRPARFDTSVEGLVYLARQGLSEKLVRAVARLDKPAPAPEPPLRIRVTAKGQLTTTDSRSVVLLAVKPVDGQAAQ
jgi:hypothetical protein